MDDVVLACLLFLAALHAVRFTPYFALAACAMLAPWNPIRTETIRPSVLTLPLAGVLVVALAAGPHVSARATAEAVRSVRPWRPPTSSRASKRQSVHDLLVGRLPIYRHIPVFVDGRTDLYFGTDILQTWLNVSDLNVDPDTVFRHWDVRWVMWNRGSPSACSCLTTPTGRSLTGRARPWCSST